MNNASRLQRALLFVHENESALLNKLGPGPCQYNTGANQFGPQNQKNTYSIPKSDRRIVVKFSEPRVPISYMSPDQQVKLVSKRGSKPIIGTYKQKFDVTKMNPVNSGMWKKGIIFY
mmetsp:Transcript_18425/g.31510  ORF Transcript_18425/g.31510 Transcript_18425/m.31510 type:complete len:117 (-) Transcript_18425:9-359(-)